MKVLFVDDDIDVLEAITCSIPSSLGIAQILTATSAEEAKRIIQSDPIDILVTDIEMPEESGIDLLRWVSGLGLPIVTMFCTCYSSFDYAQKAVELHAFDYYLKPISAEDFTQHLQRAMVEAQRRKREDALVSRRKQAFWEAVLVLRDSSMLDSRKLKKFAGYLPTDRFLIAVTYLLPQQISNISYCKMKWLDWHHGTPSSDFSIPTEFIYELADNIICTIYRSTAISEAEITKKLMARSTELQYKDYPTYTYYDTTALNFNTIDVFAKIQQFARDDINRADPVKKVCKPACSSPVTSELMLSSLRAFLVSGELHDENDRINAYLFKSTKNYSSLKAFKLAAYHMGMLLLNECGLQAQEILNDPELEELEKYAAQSILHAQLYIQKIKAIVGQAISAHMAADDPVATVQRYIDLHLDEDLSRNVLADMVYLNPDYFARLFRKQTGISMGAYILNKRIEKAMLLLRTTKKSITEIARLVGYDNSSYFTQVFQHKTGMTPMHYRNKRWK